MVSESVQYNIVGRDAASIQRSVEHGVASGALRPGDTVPSVRGLARQLGVSPSTVAAAYRDLRQRGVLVTYDRSRTVVGHRPPLAMRLGPYVPEGAVDLATGNPDPALLPHLHEPLHSLVPAHYRYGDDITDPGLAERARSAFAADGLPTDHLAVVGGGLDGIERVLEAHLRVGDRVAVEDPGYAGSLDLVRALGLVAVPIGVDDEGLRPDELAAALDRGVDALLYVPRAQNPLGAAMSEQRTRELAEVVARQPELLLVEDDHAAPIADGPYRTLLDGRTRFAVVRSVAKWLGPGLRVAMMTGDEDTVTRVLGRQRLGTGWVSQLLQQLVVRAWADAEAHGMLTRARATYAARREALLAALHEEGIEAHGRSGINVWIRVPEEVPVVQGLAEHGWAVQAGEPYRLECGPAIRVTIAGLATERAGAFAADLGTILDQRLGSRRG